MTPYITLLIPVFNERDSLALLLKEIRSVMAKVAGEYEILLVNDGSTDGSKEEIQGAVESDSRVRAIHFHRNQGKSEAYKVGFMESRGDIIVTMDGDLQDDPREVPKMLRRLKDVDMVVGWKRERLQNEPTKKIPSFLYNSAKGLLFGLRLHDSNCGFRAMKREVALSLTLVGDRYRFIPELAHLNGYRVVEMPVHHRKRRYGSSKYGGWRFISGFLDLLSVRFVTAFSQKPLHFFGTLALIPFFLGILLEIYVLFQKWAFASTFQTHVAAIIVGVLFLIVGVQLVATGLVGEMLGESLRRDVKPAMTKEGFDDE